MSTLTGAIMASRGTMGGSIYKLGMEYVPLFSGSMWNSNGPRTCSFCVISDDDRDITLYSINRLKSDAAGLIWDSVDDEAHTLTSRCSLFDYRGIVWRFELTLEGDVPSIYHPARGLNLVITHGNQTESYVRLSNYIIETLSENKWKIEINFSNLYSGMVMEDKIDVSDVHQIMLFLTTSSYNNIDHTPLAKAETGIMTLSNMESNYYVRSKTLLESPDHGEGICTGYDDSYNVPPSRIIRDAVRLGHGGMINHYCGMSHYYEMLWDDDEDRWKVVYDTSTGLPILNEACVRWHENYAKHAKANNIELIFSISYELFSLVCPYEWSQRDWEGNFSVTGYEPPSFLLSPCIPEAMQYLHNVFIAFADILHEAGLPIWMQIGEPWWWYNRDGRPCVYDYPTKLKFFEETGLYAPEIPNILDTHLTGTPYREFKDWLQEQLGRSVLDVRAAVKAKYPEARLAPLIFLPTILDESSGIMGVINFPAEMWKYPAFDFMQTEAYDWLIRDQLIQAERAFTLATEELGYPANQLHYLVGFVPDNFLGQYVDPNYDLSVDGPRIWGNIVDSLGKARRLGARSYIWAYNQVTRDNFVMAPSRNLIRWAIPQKISCISPPLKDAPYLLNGSDAFQIARLANGDIRVTWFSGWGGRFKIRAFHPIDGWEHSSEIVSGKSWTYTLTQQKKVHGQRAGSVNMSVTGVDENGQIKTRTNFYIKNIL